MDLGCVTLTTLRLKLTDIPQNLISSRSSLDKHVLKIWSISVSGFRLWNTHKLYEPHCLYGLRLKIEEQKSAKIERTLQVKWV